MSKFLNCSVEIEPILDQVHEIDMEIEILDENLIKDDVFENYIYGKIAKVKNLIANFNDKLKLNHGIDENINIMLKTQNFNFDLYKALRRLSKVVEK